MCAGDDQAKRLPERVARPRRPSAEGWRPPQILWRLGAMEDTPPRRSAPSGANLLGSVGPGVGGSQGSSLIDAHNRQGSALEPVASPNGRRRLALGCRTRRSAQPGPVGIVAPRHADWAVRGAWG